MVRRLFFAAQDMIDRNNAFMCGSVRKLKPAVHITDCVNMGLVGLEVGVDFNDAFLHAHVRFFKSDAFNVSLTAGGYEEAIRGKQDRPVSRIRRYRSLSVIKGIRIKL